MPAVPPDPDRPVLACAGRRAPVARSLARCLGTLALALVGSLGLAAWVGGSPSGAAPRTTTTTTAPHPGGRGAPTTTTSTPRSTGPASPSTTTTTTTAPPQVTALGTPTFLPLPAGSAGFSPVEMDCPTLFSCVVAGALQMPDGSRAAAVSVETGSTWTTTRVPLPVGSLGIAGGTESELTAVSCATDATCVAIGGFGPAGSATPTQGLVETGSGAIWSGSSVPLPQNAATDASAGSTLSAIACPGSDDCVISGWYIGPADATFPLLVTGSPGSWSDAPVALPPDAAAPTGGSGSSTGQGAVAGKLSAVACASPSGCAAVGEYASSTSGHPANGLVLWGSGATWSAQSVPGPSGYGAASLSQVACGPPQTCLAIGAASTSPGATNPAVPLLAEGSGSSWATVSTPLPPATTDPTQVTFDAVACAPNSDCSVFGHVGPSAPGTPTGYFTLNGSGNNLTVDQPKSFLLWPGNPWENVECPQAAMICVTGYDGPGSQSVALGWGATWTTTPVPVPSGEPANASMHLAGVTCPAPTSCVVLLAGSLGPAANAGTPNQFTPQNAVIQPVTLPDLSATTATTTTVAPPTPAAAPTTLPPFPAATTTSTVPDIEKGALGTLSANKQPVPTATIVLAVLAGLLLVALIVLWLLLGRTKRPEVAGADELGEVIPLGGTNAATGEPVPAVAAIPAPPGGPTEGEPTSAVAPVALPGVPEGDDAPAPPPMPAPFFPVPGTPPAPSPSPVIPPPGAWAPAAGAAGPAPSGDGAPPGEPAPGPDAGPAGAPTGADGANEPGAAGPGTPPEGAPAGEGPTGEGRAGEGRAGEGPAAALDGAPSDAPTSDPPDSEVAPRRGVPPL